MAKHWQSGRVKTRLGRRIGMKRAAELQRLFISHLCRSLAQVGDHRMICVAPDNYVDAVNVQLQRWGLHQQWDTVPQGGGDLGQRMQRWFGRSLAKTTASASVSAILIGADCPLLDAQTIRDASDLLVRHDVVLGPAVDGGYYLIGIRRRGPAAGFATAELFDSIPWSTDRVFEMTASRVRRLGLSLARLETREDIDTVTELENLREIIRNDRGLRDFAAAVEGILIDESLADPIDADD